MEKRKITVHSSFSYEPGPGIKIKQKKITVPNQSLSLKEILRRFVRNETVPVGKDTSYATYADVDLEKIQHADLVDRAAFIGKLSEISRLYQIQEKKKQLEAEEKALLELKKKQPPVEGEA